MLDIHCHILPGVDDGSESLFQSKQMLRAALEVGIDHIVCTPHCRGSHYDARKIAAAYEELLPYASRMGIKLDLGVEVYWEKLIELGIDTAPSLCLGESNLLLLEFGCSDLPPGWERLVYEIQKQGLAVVIAHPERYAPVRKNLDIAFRMKELDCYLQLSGNFVNGGFTSKGRRCAISLLKAGLVDYVASDAHCVEDYADFRDAIRIAEKY